MHEDEILGKAYDARLMRRLLTYLLPYKWHAAAALAAILGHSALQLAPPYLTKIAIDEHIAAGRLEGLGLVAATYLAVLIGAFALEYTQTYLMQLTGQRIMFDLRMAIYGRLQELDVRFYDRNPVGRLMTRVTTDVDVLNELFAGGVVAVFGDVFTLAGIMIVMLVIDWQLALVSFAVLPLIAVVTQWFRRNVRESYRTVRMWIARINAFLQENITGMPTVQLFRREALNYRRFDEINAKHRDANIDSIFYYAVFYPSIELIGSMAAAIILWAGGLRVMSDTLTLGVLVAFIQYSSRFYQPISDLSEKFNILQSAMASSERIFKLLDEPVTITSPPAPKRRDPSKPPHIRFDHVWFAYNDEDYVLKDVTFEVAPGERVGIVGATGSGKTTIVNLLMRFYDVTRGRILIDGIDVRELALEDVRRMIALVLQDVHLFSGTIEANIRLGEDQIDESAIEQAAAAVGANRFIESLPERGATVLGERGASLSVGQKQLLSFARALAFDRPVLVLDEATSSVDTETELAIRKALTALMRGRTTLAIAHRLSTIQDMDRILVLHKGVLRESGTHQELLAARGIYYKLFQLQFRRGLPEPAEKTV
ncbi:MAG TPA: ABC transporter ATP-binding protein [Vicinamibacterales bacterium]|nr:ABC transporter ATP-binding protein [Vicinamibacterales bacterium]